MKRDKVTITTGTTEAFFNRVRSHAAALDRGESIPAAVTISFEDPSELVRAPNSRACTNP